MVVNLGRSELENTGMNAKALVRSRVGVGTWLALAALAAACRVNPTSPSMENSVEGKACPPDAKIEDGEDNNNQILVQGDRAGYVYTYADAQGTTMTPAGGGVFTMSPGGANGSQYALHMSGQLASSGIVFAAIGLNFADPRGPYDASKYKGVAFFAKKGPGSTSKVRIKLPDKNTDPDGGVCAACANDFGMQLSLSEEWQKFIVPFSALRQESGWGNPRPRSVSPEAVYALQFQVNDKGKPFDVWIDDLAFTGCP
jgi:endoglucanase